MENKLIEQKDLQIGDEIIISCQSFFKYLKVLSPPALSKTRVHWSTKQPMYANFKCTTRQDLVNGHSYTDRNGVKHTRINKVWVPTAEEHNIRISQDLNGRQIWLVKRESNN